MNEDKPVVYDPNPLDLELEIFGDLSNNQLNLTELAKPETVRFLLHNQRIAIAKLKLAEKEKVALELKNTNLLEDRENLRIKLARREERRKITWFEIPTSVLSGFAINMLTKNFSDGIGWILLILSLIMLSFLRVNDIIQKSNSKEEIK